MARLASLAGCLLIAACSSAPATVGPGSSPTARPSGSTAPTASNPAGASATPGRTAEATNIPEPTNNPEPTPSAGSSEVVGGWRIRGTVTGLEGSGLMVYALGEQEPITANGPFAFEQPLPDGAIYDVRVVTQPSDPDQACTVTNGAGTIFGADAEFGLDCVTVADNPALDANFGTKGRTFIAGDNAQGEAIAIQDDGKIVVAGRMALNGTYDFAVARLNTDGNLDTTFGQGGVVTTDVSAGGMDEAYDLAIQDDRKIVVVGTVDDRRANDFGVVRYLEDGKLDTGFGTGGIVRTDFGGPDYAQGVVIQDDGMIVVAGNIFIPDLQDNDFGVARYTKEGQLDSSFGEGGKVHTTIEGKGDLAMAVALTVDQKIVVGGRVAIDGGASADFGLVQYTHDGKPDPKFGTDGIVTTDFKGGSDDVINGLVIDGVSIIAAGYSIGEKSFDFAAAKYRQDGKLDTTFGKNGLVTTEFGGDQDYGQAIALAKDHTFAVVGQVAAAATIADLGIARYTEKGVADPAKLVSVDFHGSGDTARDAAFDADGKLVVVGWTQNGRNTEFVVVRTAV